MDDNKNAVIIAAETGDSGEDSHDGSGGSSGKGGKGQGGKGGVNGSGSTGGSGGSGKGSGSGKGGSGGSGGSSGGKPIETGGTKPLYVTVEWPSGTVAREVEVTLMNSESSKTKVTENNKVTFFTEPGDEWILIGESIEGFIIPEVSVAIKGSDEEAYATLKYVAGTTLVNKIELNKTNLELLAGDNALLIAKAYPTNANNKTLVWSTNNPDIVTVDNNGYVLAKSEGTAVIKAKSTDDSNITATCNVTVIPINSVVHVEGITLEEDSINMNLGDKSTYLLKATVSPMEATIKDVIWSSSNESVATVDENGNVTAISTGFAIITVTTLDGGWVAYAQISVGAAPETVYIYPFSENSNDEHFDSPYEVSINVEELVKKLITDGTMDEDGVLYYVKITEKGTSLPLGEGEITLFKDTKSFKISDEIDFKPTENYSDRYFVYMSQYPDYPKDDEKTLSTNFMGGSSTPTIPKENVVVNLEIHGGNASKEGIIFLLAREEFFGSTLEDVSWREFYNGDIPENPYSQNGVSNVDLTNFVDEVKMVGKTNSLGKVEWIEPRETLKLGGYLLLEVTPLGYKDNLSMLNPDSDDDDFLKQVTLMRDGGLNIKVINIYTGSTAEHGTPNDPPIDNPDPPTNPPTNPPTLPTNPPSGSDDSTGTSGGTSDSSNLTSKYTDDDYVKINESDKFNGHWAKIFVDNIIQKGKMHKTVFENVKDLNDEAYFNDVYDMVYFIDDLDLYETQDLNLLNVPITRQQATVLLMDFFGFKPDDNPILNFIDFDEIEPVSRGYVAAACRLEVISGYPDNTFKPNNTLTKAELFTIISKCLDIKNSVAE